MTSQIRTWILWSNYLPEELLNVPRVEYLRTAYRTMWKAKQLVRKALGKRTNHLGSWARAETVWSGKRRGGGTGGLGGVRMGFPAPCVYEQRASVRTTFLLGWSSAWISTTHCAASPAGQNKLPPPETLSRLEHPKLETQTNPLLTAGHHCFFLQVYFILF